MCLCVFVWSTRVYVLLFLLSRQELLCATPTRARALYNKAVPLVAAILFMYDKAVPSVAAIRCK